MFKTGIDTLIGMASSSALISQIKDNLKPASKDKPIELYTEVVDNWYRALPYAFRAKIDDEVKIFYLPISPKNLTITTYFATNIIPTLYGTVEEHSEQRYFDITISGTTGFAPQFTNEFPEDASFTPNPGRTKYEVKSEIYDEVKGLMPKVFNKLENALNQAGSVIKTITGSNSYENGISNNLSGYAAFHALYKFLLKYKRTVTSGDTGSSGNKFINKLSHTESTSQSHAAASPLQFINYKDNNQYSCAVQRFTLERSADNPMLYDYVIVLKAYNLSPIAAEKAPDLSERFANLGLDSKMSYASTAKVAIKNGKGALSSKNFISTLK